MKCYIGPYKEENKYRYHLIDETGNIVATSTAYFGNHDRINDRVEKLFDKNNPQVKREWYKTREGTYKWCISYMKLPNCISKEYETEEECKQALNSIEIDFED